jgi:hypothetical protein
MRALRDQPTPKAGKQLRARMAEEENELALLAQFMRHASVASLAQAIAERQGVRSGDLIAAAGLDPSLDDS